MALVAMVVVVVLLALLLLWVDCGGDGGGSVGSRGGGGAGGGGRGRGRGRRLLVVPPSRGCERNRRSSSALVFQSNIEDYCSYSLLRRAFQPSTQ